MLNLTLKMRLNPDDLINIAAPIHQSLEEKGLGRLSVEEGSGYMTNKDGEMTECDFDVFSDCLNKRKVTVIQQELNKLEFIPKGSCLKWRNQRFAVGNAVMLTVYLDSSCSNIDALLWKCASCYKDKGLYFFSHWKGDKQTALYFYGSDIKMMKQTISELLQLEADYSILEQN